MRPGRAAAACLAAALLAAAAPAQDLTLPPGATLTRELRDPADTYFLPVGPYEAGDLPVREIEGRILIQAWRLEAQDITTLQILAPLREQLLAAGYEVLFDCTAQECGGFDFRFETRILPAPDMFVDLFDYRYLAARRTAPEGDGAAYLSVVVSRAGASGYLQITRIAPRDAATGLEVSVPRQEPALPEPPPGPEASLAQALTGRGHVVLADLSFETGSSALGPGPFASLRELAAFLKADAARRVALVGHTDSTGALDGNIALSRRRAASVLERLVKAHGVPSEQLEAGGMGYLAPVASNLSPAGREANRRVEAVLLNTE